MLRYYQSTGKLVEIKEAGSVEKQIGIGWAGNDNNPEKNPDHIQGKNNPAQQFTRYIGPLPQGLYLIQKPIHHVKLGPLAFPLSPDPKNVMKGRDAFYIHGPSSTHMGQESWGCIIMPHQIRQYLSDTLKYPATLEVVA
jgi:hypothetical protein